MGRAPARALAAPAEEDCDRFRKARLSARARVAVPLLVTAALASTGAPVFAQLRECTVVHVVDGDTVNCRGGEVVRLLLIDAPDHGRFGQLARSALAALLPVGETFSIELDERERDGDGRLLAYLFREDGRMINEMMVRQGYAFLEPSPVNKLHADRLRAAERFARESGRGIWSP